MNRNFCNSNFFNIWKKSPKMVHEHLLFLRLWKRLQCHLAEMFIAEVFILVLMLKSQYKFNLFIALAFCDSEWVMLWVIVILLIAQNWAWDTLINEYITKIFKEKLPGFQAQVGFTIWWLYFYFIFKSKKIILHVNGNTLNIL